MNSTTKLTNNAKRFAYFTANKINCSSDFDFRTSGFQANLQTSPGEMD